MTAWFSMAGWTHADAAADSSPSAWDVLLQCHSVQLYEAVTQGAGALLLQRNYDLHRALAGKPDSVPAAAPAGSLAEPVNEDFMDEDEPSPSSNATEEDEDADMSTAGKKVRTSSPSHIQVCLSVMCLHCGWDCEPTVVVMSSAGKEGPVYRTIQGAGAQHAA